MDIGMEFHVAGEL